MIDKILKKTGVGIALLFMIMELSYVNSKSLQYMIQGDLWIDAFFGVIGAIAFSIVTVLVMRLSKANWLKIVFPIFDSLLMFCGLNLNHHSDLFDNPVRFAMSIFLSLLTGLTTYSLGQINADQHSETNSESKIESLSLERELLATKLQVTNSKIIELEKLITEYKPGFLLYERSRILKKLPANRNERDLDILSECEILNK